MYVGLRDLKWAWGRFALIGGVIVLITVLVGLLSGLTRGLGEQSTSAVTGLDTHSLVFGGDGFDSSVVPVDLVPGATPLGFATVRASGPAGTGAVAVIGVPAGSKVAPDSRGVAPGRVVLSDAAGALLGGDSVRVAGEKVAVAGTRGEASYSHLPVVWTTLADWQHLAGVGAGSATVLATDGSVGPLPARYDVRTLADSLSAIGSYSSEQGSLLLIRTFLLVISALVVGAFFTVWTIQRSGDIAVLKALGASTAALMRDAVGQAAVVLLIGVGAGSALALGIGAVASGSVPFVLDAATLLPPVALLGLLGLGGAALAVRTVTSVDPLTALNGH